MVQDNYLAKYLKSISGILVGGCPSFFLQIFLEFLLFDQPFLGPSLDKQKLKI